MELTDCRTLDQLPNNKILDTFELKSVADDKSDTSQMIRSACDWSEDITGKGENAGYQHFLFSQNVFKSVYSQSH